MRTSRYIYRVVFIEHVLKWKDDTQPFPGLVVRNETHEKREPSNRRRLSSLLAHRGRTQLPTLHVLSVAGVMVKDLTEVLVRIDRGSTATKGNEALGQERTIFLVLVEVIRVARNVVAYLPDTLSPNIASAIERVEGCRYAGNRFRCRTIVGRRDQRTVSTGEHVAG